MALALQAADFSQVTALAIDQTARARGNECITVAAAALQRRVWWVGEGRAAATLEAVAAQRRALGSSRFATIGTVVFLIAGKLDFSAIDPHAR